MSEAREDLKSDRTNATAERQAGSVRIIWFDVGGVLSEDRIEDKLADLAQQHDVSLERMLAIQGAIRLEADLGRLSDADFWRQVLAEVGVEATEVDCRIEPYVRAVPGSLELVRRLHGRHRLGILSNDSRELARARWELLGYQPLFDPIVISSDLGLVKPDRRIYQRACAIAQVAPAQCLFIDNRQDNVLAARACGWQAVVFEGAPDLETTLLAAGLL